MAIIKKLRQAVISGALPPGEVPVEDLKSCVELELETNKLTFLDPQFDSVMGIYRDLCGMVNKGETDSQKMLLFLLGLEQCLNTISDAVLSLVGREYWTMVHADKLPDPEIEEIIDFVERRKQVRLLPYDFVEDYLSLGCVVSLDEDCGMSYVIHKGKRMYFPAKMNEREIADYYNVILAEQDERSPHCYRMDGYNVKKGDVLVDVGGAEGFFTLYNIDIITKAYVFDADPDWFRAMEKTFAPYADKVELHFGYVGGVADGGQNITLDEVLAGVKVNYIKMDIEGYEKEALNGAKALLERSDDLRCAICAYHCEEDEKEIPELLGRMGMETAHSRGYMCPDWCNTGLLKAQLRRGVIFGRKKS
ncbi:MAG: FkbM family methyltransferase [Lachnospiraceae bacterium]|nr:FkbM family methyltransferase [Lachnospiraceae bacterium]